MNKKLKWSLVAALVIAVGIWGSFKLMPHQNEELAKAEGNIDLSKDDFSKLTALLLSKSLKELNAIQQDEDTPIWIVNIVRAIVKDSNEGRISTLDTLLDRLFGKATQPTQQSVAVEMKGSIPVSEWVKDRLKK